MSRPLEQLGRAVARAQDAALDASQHEPSVPAWLSSVQQAPRPKPRWPRFAVASLAIAAAALLALWLVPRERSLTFVVGGRSSSSRWLASSDKPLAVQFSDGSAVRLAAQTHMRVARLDGKGAGLLLERGRVALSVFHREQTLWTIEAGPFHTRVVGTRFSVEWEPKRGEFALQLEDGAVELTGPVIGKRRVAQGERVTVALHQQRADVQLVPGGANSWKAQPAEVTRSAEQATPTAAPRIEEPRSAVKHRAARRTPRASEESKTKPVVASEPEFVRLARAGQYAQAVASVSGARWAETLASSGVGPLLLLGDAARLSAHAAEAEQVYLRVRSRFPGSREAAMAAFALGRMQHDQRRNLPKAVEWFATYLREAPRGSLACEAEGRLMETTRALGRREEAARTALAYLQRCPGGSHSRLALELTRSPAR